jgi:hypothetical protein
LVEREVSGERRTANEEALTEESEGRAKEVFVVYS